jgi:glycosyltransferase involved in cell wall biosynthesis
MIVFPGAVERPFPDGVSVKPTLSWGGARVPYRAIGQLRALRLHDHLVARRLPALVGKVDLVHTWPLGARATLRTAARLGIPTVLERPNAHTRFAYEVVRRECERIGVTLPSDHEHAWNDRVLEIEEEEYELADALLCPSDFVVDTFLGYGLAREKLVRHFYGYDEESFYPEARSDEGERGLTMLFVGVGAVRKGLHFALEAWLRSPASESGTFLIAGELLSDYRDYLSGALAHPSVHVLGHRTDVPELMRRSDVLVLPSIEEGFGLVCTEALGSGCVPVVSDACTEICRHEENALVHRVGDVDALERHITMLHADRKLLARLRAGCLATAPEVTWTAAGVGLLQAYREVVAGRLPIPTPMLA